jgi:hypothetical protein
MAKSPTRSRKAVKRAAVKSPGSPRAAKAPAVARAARPTGAAAPVAIGLQLSLGEGSGAGELDEATRLLLDELRGLDVASVVAVGKGKSPAASKGFGLAEVGGLVVELVGGKAFGNVITALKAWMGRDAGRNVKLVIGGNSIEVSNISKEQQARLIEMYVQQVGATSARPAGDG